MRFAKGFSLPVAASAAAALAACSGAGPVAAGNGASGNGTSGAPAAPVSQSTAPPVNFASEDGPFELARALCTDSTVRRFGIAGRDVTGASFGGGGETPQSLEGQATIDLFGPPARHFRCEIAGGAVASVSEVDHGGNPIAPRN